MSFNSLDSILGEAQKGLVTGNISKNINITDIIDTPDARTEIEDDNHTIAELAQSIQENGLIQPISLRKTGNGYEVLAGRRRLAAVKTLHWENIPAVIHEDVDDRKAEAIMLQENIHRKDFSQFELAQQIRKMRDEGMSLDEIAKMFGKKESWVRMFISISGLSPELIEEIEQGGRVKNATALSSLASIEKINPELAMKTAQDITDNPEKNYQDIIKEAREKVKEDGGGSKSPNKEPAKKQTKVEKQIEEKYPDEKTVISTLISMDKQALPEAETALKRAALRYLEPYHQQGNDANWNDFADWQSNKMFDKGASAEKRLLGMIFLLGFRRERLSFLSVCEILNAL